MAKKKLKFDLVKFLYWDWASPILIVILVILIIISKY